MGESAPAPAPMPTLHRGPCLFWITRSGTEALFKRVTDVLQRNPSRSNPSQTKVHNGEQPLPNSGEPIPARCRHDWSSRAAETQLDPHRTLPLNQFHHRDHESTSPRWHGRWSEGWTRSDQLTAWMTELKLGEASRVYQRWRTHQDLD
jgi:hypothetical protein